MYKIASIDYLAGLKNRREFDNQLTFFINLARRENRFVSLIMCDIDNFKQYNDFHGHYAGDECLVKVAYSISRSCHRTMGVVCRYGGEEFAVILYGNKINVANLAEDIRQGVSSINIPHRCTDQSSVTLSVGYVSVIPKTETNPKSHIEKADLALYQAKKNGRNQCVPFI
ncbi:GGDEF domain-containing protein [Photobacterium sp. OFAV2-7]|uniref:GGDEF domain-containing protein n=1 Tax=Photobacterium sp. OFAV2-7 TaxID=2917748 RepID=UPI001EF6936E|nr:GGDEF domain-containing protein [Photobacterium sp. OFAV2-7]MCG7587760.1 GGDEF domain-containing protein [Photobacterium sp. OFAV2-7]